jgi:hypothetical protein
VICRHSKPVSAEGRDKVVRPLSDKRESFSGGTFPSTSSFPYSLRLDNQADNFLVPSWYTENESDITLPCLPTDVDTKKIKEASLIKESPEHPSNNDTENPSIFKGPIKYPRIEDIEIFHEEHLKIQRPLKKRQRNSRHSLKTHKESSATSKNIDHHPRNSHDRMNVQFEEVRKGTGSITNGASMGTVCRSSTFPAFHTWPTEGKRRFTDADEKVRRLSHPLLLHTSYSNLNQRQTNVASHQFTLSTQLPERVAVEKCIVPGTMCSNASIILRSESYLQSGVASFREQSQSLPDINESTTR